MKCWTAVSPVGIQTSQSNPYFFNLLQRFLHRAILCPISSNTLCQILVTSISDGTWSEGYMCVGKIRSHASHHLKWNIQHCVYQSISGLLPTTEEGKSQNCSWFTNNGESLHNISLHNISLHSTHYLLVFYFLSTSSTEPKNYNSCFGAPCEYKNLTVAFSLQCNWRWSPTRT